jgi:hypothetical protein
MDDLPLKWRLLIDRLWKPDGQSVTQLLPEIVHAIKSTRPSVAERVLLEVLLSPKVRDMPRRLPGPVRVVPGYQMTKLMAEAAGLPPGKMRNNEIAKINKESYGIARTPEEIVAKFSALPERPKGTEITDATAQAAKRARRELGIPRKPGRPKGTGREKQ